MKRLLNEAVAPYNPYMTMKLPKVTAKEESNSIILLIQNNNIADETSGLRCSVPAYYMDT